MVTNTGVRENIFEMVSRIFPTIGKIVIYTFPKTNYFFIYYGSIKLGSINFQAVLIKHMSWSFIIKNYLHHG